MLGLDFELTAEQRAVRSLTREFAREVIRPAAAELDRESRFPYAIVGQMADLGLFGLPFPESVGGVGGDFLSYCLALEEVAWADAGVAITLEAAVSLGATPIYDFGSPEQRQRWLPDLLSGRRLWAFGLTEPGAGSDAGATATRALLKAGEWTIEGNKQFITNSGTDITAGVTVTCRTDPGDGREPEISALLVPAGTPGLGVLPAYHKTGWRCSDTHPLALEGCRVPEANLLGRRGGGYAQFLRALTAGRIAIAALATGQAQACLDAALAHARERQAFGRPISQFQAIGFKLADMSVEVDLARLATHRAAIAFMDPGTPQGELTRFASVAKLFASETAKRAADEAVQIHGGYGLMEESVVSRFWRDAKFSEIGEGTSEVQRILIAREIGC